MNLHEKESKILVIVKKTNIKEFKTCTWNANYSALILS